MENMIKKIVDADNEAKAMEKDTLEEKEELSKTIEAETKKIYDDFMAKAEEVVKRNDIRQSLGVMRIIFKIRHNLSDALACKQTLVILFGKSVAEL